MSTQTSQLIGMLEPAHRLTKDLAKGLKGGDGGITDTDARYLVDMYYQMQKHRIQLNNQIKGLERDAKTEGGEEEPHEVIVWVYDQAKLLENQIKRALGYYVENHPMAWFFEQTLGIGPVLAAGLLAHIDIEKAPTAGHIWSFAGLNPDQVWEKGKKRPHNAELKKLCWKIGESFVKVSGREDAYYGRVYKQRKDYENDRNDRGELADQAKAKLERFKIGKTTDAYASYSIGKLPPAHIHQRACRYATKLFLSHLQQRWYEEEFDKAAPIPYVIAHQEHVHVMQPPQTKIV